MRNVSVRATVGQLFALTLLVPTIASAQSTNITGYVLLAEESLRAKRLTVESGDLGVTTGMFSSRTSLAAPDSDVAAPMVKFSGSTTCDTLFATSANGTTAECGNPLAFTNPFPDLAEACGYPTPFPACAPGSPVLVAKGQTTVLPPGVYGDVKVEGGSGPKATLILSGETTICNLTVARDGKVLFDGPSTLNVTGTVTTSNATEIGPLDTNTGADDIEIFVDGTRFRASRRAAVRALVCAPNGRFSAGTSATLEGRFVAQTIRLKKNRVALAGMMPPTTTTTVPPTTTTSTTLPPAVCGNGILEAGEECDTDQFGNATCPGSSVIGAFLTCTGACEIDFSECPGGSTTTSTVPPSTTTTIVTTTTTIPPSTTTTTVPPAVCGNGIVEPGEACDGDIVCEGSAAGSFLDCSDDCLTIIDEGPCGSTTTTVPTTSTTTTTIVTGPVCGNGITEEGEVCDDGNTDACDLCSADCTAVEGCGNGILEPACGEVCDGQDFGDATCPGGSPGGALLGCSADCSTIDTSRCEPLEVVEICGNCIDDNGDGMTDFEDPTCCAGPQAFLSTLRRSNVKPRSTTQSFLRIKSILATAGLMPQPMNEDVFLQIRDQNGTEVLCAKVPAGKMMMRGKKKTFKFWWDRKNKVRIASAQNIDDMKVAIKKNGTIRFSAYGKRVNLKTPAPGPLTITVGFRDPIVGDASNQCSSVTQPYRAVKKGAIKFP